MAQISLPTDRPHIFGQHFANRNLAPVVVCGSRSWNKYDLGAIGCPHLLAAHTVDRVLKQLGARSLEDVVDRFSPEDFVRVKGFRVTAFYALICLLDDAKISVSKFYKNKVTVETLSHNTKHNKARKKRSKAA